MPQINQRYA